VHASVEAKSRKLLRRAPSIVCLAVSATNHDGDSVVVDEAHDASKDKPLKMWGGKNPQTPPCFQGRFLPGGMMIINASSNTAGAPTSNTMDRSV
jgi:hypothetical protein